MNKVQIQTGQDLKIDQDNRYYFDVTKYLTQGQTVASATASHVPPVGTPASVTVETITGGVIPILIGPLNVNNQAGAGVKHYVDVDVVLASPTENPGWRLFFEVPC